MATLISNTGQLENTLKQAEPLPVPSDVLMVTPEHFSIDYIINPHMERNIGTVDAEKARGQWEVIRDTFRRFGLTVHELKGQPGLPDMVFSANQSLPVPGPDEKKNAVMSIMHSTQRMEEVPWFEQWYRTSGYALHYPDPDQVAEFEGTGDAIWHFKKRLLWGGYGFRSSKTAYDFIAETFDVPVVMLELTQPGFYHLDTCFCVLNSETALIYPKAFTQDGLELIHSAFPNVIEAPGDEAQKLLACNAACPDGHNVVIQKGCREVNKALKQNGFVFHEVDTSEFLKSGGSVFCLKLMLW